MNRRTMITSVIAASAAGSLGSALLQAQQAVPPPATPPVPAASAPPKPVPPKVVDPEPHVNDIEKYPRCNYCGMDRKRFHHSRMLIPYADDTVDALCSIRCTVSSLTINLGRRPKTIWVGDNASAAEIKPLVDAEQASYLVSSKLPGVMTRRSKVAYSTAAAAAESKAANGGEVLDFDKALLAAYTDVADSVSANLKRRKEPAKDVAKEPRQ